MALADKSHKSLSNNILLQISGKLSSALVVLSIYLANTECFKSPISSGDRSITRAGLLDQDFTQPASLIFVVSIIVITIVGIIIGKKDSGRRDKKKNKSRSKTQNSYENLVPGLFDKFLNTSLENADQEITDSLRIIAESQNCNHGMIILLDKDTKDSDFKYEWHADSAPLTDVKKRASGKKHLSRLIEKMNAGELIIYENLDHEIDSAEADKVFLKEIGIKSAIMIPMYREKSLFGYLLTYSNKRHISWNQESTHLLKISTMIIAGIIFRKIADEKTIDQEKHFLKIGQMTPDAILIFQDNSIVYANQPAADMAEANSPDDLIGKNPMIFMSNESLGKALIDVQKGIEGKISSCYQEYELIGMKGRKLSIEAVILGLIFKNRPAVEIIARDITPRKIMEKQIRTSEESYQNLFQNAQVGLYRTRVSDGVVLACNDQIARMCGFSSAEEGMKHYKPRDNYVNSEVQERIMKILREQGEFNNIEAELYRCDRTTFWARLSGKLNRKNGWIEGVVEDINEHKKAREELKKSEIRFKDLAELLPQAVFETDRQGYFIYLNYFGQQFTGYNRDEINHRLKLTDLADFSDKERMRSCLDSVILGKKMVGVEFKILKKNGSKAIVSIYTNPIMHDDKTVGLRGIIIDITQKKNLQEFISQAQRLETAGRIAGQVAHDFNNLLGPILAYPDLIIEEFPEQHPALGYIEDIKKSAQQLSEINQQLLTLGRRGHYSQTTLNLNETIDQAIGLIFPPAPKLKIEKNLNHDLPGITGGESQIMRVLANLISNARDAMHDDGILTFATDIIHLTANTGNWKQIPAGKYVRMTVTDTGGGIHPDILPRIFDPFFTTKKADKKRGSGLGLSTVFAVMEDHHGFIDCQSEIGSGTSFHLYFPTLEKTDLKTLEEELVGGTEKILVVDEDQTQRELCENLLKKLGYSVFVVGSGEKAFELIKHENFDLIMLDPSATRPAADLFADQSTLDLHFVQKTILISGNPDSKVTHKAMKLGIGEILPKPLTLKSVAVAVRRELDKNHTSSKPLSIIR